MNSDKLKRRYMERWNQVAKEESEAMSVAKIGLLRRWLSPRDGPYKAALEVIRLSDIEKRGFAVVDAAEEMLQIGHLEPSRETYKLVLGELTRVSEGIRRNVSAGDQ